MSLAWNQHLILVPVLLPLFSGALLVPFAERRHRFKFAVNMISVLCLLAVSLVLLQMTDGEHWRHGIGVYLAANWAAPFGIALAVDRLAAMMLLLTALMALAALLYSMRRWSQIGVHFHSLFQFLLMGINGAFLTHDLFNLFVFFEVMLAASYGLLLHGYTVERIRAGMQYISINLVASLLFLIGVALIYASTGTLNMADLAARMSSVAPDDLILLKIGVTVLALAFLVKSAMWPLCFWLPRAYAAASPPVGAMLVLMTKVGAYAILRVWLLAFSDEAGMATGFGFEALVWGGIATIIYGAAGLLASEVPGRMAGYAAIVSSGTLLAVIGYGQPSVIVAGLYYLIGSTLSVAAFLLLIELIERIRTPGAAVLALTIEAFAIEEKPEETAGLGIPAALAFLALSFAGCALIIAGMPPLSGFVAKFGLFHALLNPGAAGTPVPTMAWALIAVIVGAGLAAIIALMRFGVRTFWASGAVTPPRLLVSEAVPIMMLLAAAIVLTVQAGPAYEFLQRASAGLHRPANYIERVMSEREIPGVLSKPGAEGGR